MLPSGGALWLGAILLLLAAIKLTYSAAFTFPAGYDAGYYTNIVQNLLSGNGLTTNVSLYHRGFREFPHADSIYPLWPLTYAAFASVFSIDSVAVWLPTTLYFLSLITAYLWGRRLFPADLSRRVKGFNAGHVLTLMLGLQTAYFVHTTRPYTEALAYTLLFLFLWRATLLLDRLSLKSGLELGVWLGVLLLVRSQFVIVVAALALTLFTGLALYRKERRTVFMFGVCVVGALLLTLLPYLLYVKVQTGLFSVWNYIFFGETPTDSPLSQARPYVRPSGLSHLATLAHGVAVAFRWKVKYSYRGSFHLYHYALLALPVLAVATLWRDGVGRAQRARAWAWLRDRNNARWIFFILLAALFFLSVQLLVKNHDRWYFHRRHNLVALPLFFFALIALLRSRYLPMALLGVALLSGGVYLGGVRLTREALKQQRKPPARPKPDIVAWLNQEQARLGRPLIVAYNRPQVVVWQTPQVSFHEVNVEISTLDDVLLMFDQLGVDYLLSPDSDEVRHRQPKERFEAELEWLSEVDLGKVRVYRRAHAGDAPAAPPAFGGAASVEDDTDDL